MDAEFEDDGGPPFSSDGEFIGPRRMPVIDLPTVMRDTACAALSTIDQAVEADNCLAAHLEPVKSFLIELMSWPISLQCAGDNLELQAGGSLRLIEELLKRLVRSSRFKGQLCVLAARGRACSIAAFASPFAGFGGVGQQPLYRSAELFGEGRPESSEGPLVGHVPNDLL